MVWLDIPSREARVVLVLILFRCLEGAALRKQSMDLSLPSIGNKWENGP